MNNERIRVLMVLDSLAVGGTETHVLSIVKALQKLGIPSVYAGAGGKMYDAFARAGCPIHAVDLSPAALYHIQEGTFPQLIRPLQQLMRSRKINVVHVHQTPSGTYAAMAAKELGIPVIFTAHGTYYPEDQLQIIEQYSNAIISVSSPVQAYLKRMNIDSELIPNGVDPEDFYAVDSTALGAALGIPAGADTVVYASRLSWDKAYVCTKLILAARKLRMEGLSPLHVVIVGDGNQYDEIRQLAQKVHEEIGETFIHMAGNQKMVRDYFSLGDIVVGTGRVALEAMACGKPVLAIGNHGFFGLVTPSTYGQAWSHYFGDHDSTCKPSEQLIAESLRSALADKKALQRVGIQGRSWVAQHFDIHKIVERIIYVYKQVQQPGQRKGGS